MIGAMSAAAIGAAMLAGLFGVDGNGTLKTEDRKVAAFTGVEIGGGIKAEVRTGNNTRVTLTTDENLLPLIKTEVKDGVLQVRPSQSIDPSRDVRLVVEGPTIHHLGASGGVELKAEVAASDQFSLAGSGGADLDVKGIATKKLVMELSGGVDAKLSGRADEARYELSGGVEVDASGMEVKVAKLDASGGVNAKLAVSERLEGSASGGVSVKVKGRPAIKVSTSGGAGVTTAD